MAKSWVGIAWFLEVIFGSIGWDLIFWVTEHGPLLLQQLYHRIPSKIYFDSILNVFTFTALYISYGKLFQNLINQLVIKFLLISSLNFFIARLIPVCSCMNIMHPLMWVYNVPWVLFLYLLSFPTASFCSGVVNIIFIIANWEKLH